MKVFITGAAGFIGSHLAERLARSGHEVVGLDCYTNYYPQWLKRLNADDLKAAGIPIHELDLATDDLREVTRGIDIVYHLAGQPGISATVPLETYVRNNLIATHRLLEAVRGHAQIKLFINISTSSVYGLHATDNEDAAAKPVSHYGVTKLAGEQLVLSYARERILPACSLRLFSVYGPRERPDKLFHQLIASILRNKAFPFHEGSGEHRRSFTYVSDIVDGSEAVLQQLKRCNGEILNLGWDQESLTAEAIQLVEELLGRPARLLLRPARPGDQQRSHADITKARKLLGYAPRVGLREGLTRQIEWYRQKILPRRAEP